MKEKEMNPQAEAAELSGGGKIRFKATQNEFYRGLMVGERLGPSRKRKMIVIPTLLLIAGLYGWMYIKDRTYTQGMVLFCISMAMVLFALLYPRFMAFRVAKRFAALPHEFMVEIGKKAIYVDYDREHTVLDFEADSVEIIDSRKFFVVNYRRGHVFVIPKAYMTEEQIEAARHNFVRKIPKKYKLVQYRGGNKYGK